MKHTTQLGLMVLSIMAAGGARAATVIYMDNFNDQQNIYTGGPYSQTLAGSTPTVRTNYLGGTSGATWLAGVETNGWGQRDYDGTGVATPTSSNFLYFSPISSATYTVQMTVDTTPLGGADPSGTSSWITVGFTASQHNWNGADSPTIDTNDLVRFYSNTSTTISYTVSGADLVAAGVHYVGWITDSAGSINLGGSKQVTIDNFSLTAVPEPSAALACGFGSLVLMAGRRRTRSI